MFPPFVSLTSNDFIVGVYVYLFSIFGSFLCNFFDFCGLIWKKNGAFFHQEGERNKSSKGTDAALQGLIHYISQLGKIKMDVFLKSIWLVIIYLINCWFPIGEPSDSGPTTPLPDKKLLEFILERLQK